MQRHMWVLLAFFAWSYRTYASEASFPSEQDSLWSFDAGISALHSGNGLSYADAKTVFPVTFGISTNKLQKARWGMEAGVSYFRIFQNHLDGHGMMYALALSGSFGNSWNILAGYQIYFVSLREHVVDKESITFLNFLLAPVVGLEYEIVAPFHLFLSYSLASHKFANGQWHLGFYASVPMFL